LTNPVRQSELFDAVATALARAGTPVSASTGAPVGAPTLREPVASVKGNSSPADEVLSGLRNLRLRVLVAEDNEVNQEVAREMLIDAGCKVDLVSTGAAAVEAAATRDYDLALMDCQMPEMDGFEAARRIRNAEVAQAAAGRRRLSIIALTANAIQGDRERCLSAGMDAYVSKPVNPETLYQTIYALVKPTGEQTPRPAATESAASADAPLGEISHSPINLDTLLPRCRGKAHLVESLLTKFEAAVGPQLEQLRGGLERADGAAVSRLAHTIKGASANLSADRVSAVAAKLEQLGESGDWESVARTLKELEAHVRECLDYVPAAAASAKERARQGAAA
jgi:two-component system sensor histidine kinase/response regulator